MPPVPPELLKARIAANRARLYLRLVRVVEAFELDDMSAFTSEQREALRQSRKTIDEIRKGFEE